MYMLFSNLFNSQVIFATHGKPGCTGESPCGFRDYQEVKIQEQVQKLEVGKVSSSPVLALALAGWNIYLQCSAIKEIFRFHSP